MECMVMIVIYSVLLSVLLTSVNSRLPLIEDDEEIFTRKTPGCRLGTSFYDLEETWNPILSPDGVMVCLICQCIPVVKKGVLQSKGRVTCRNIKEECPTIECENPILLPDQCCKTCPGQGPPMFKSFLDPMELIPPPSLLNRGMLYPVARDAYPAQDFKALLVGRSKVSNTKTRALASAQFSLQQNSLAYTLNYGKLSYTPTKIHFLDEDGNILDEKFLNDSSLNKLERQICGKWSYLPSIYLKFLVSGKLFIALMVDSKPKPFIGGKIHKYDSLATDSLTSLLISKKKSGSGAVVMMTMNLRGNTLSFVLHSKGLLSKSDLESSMKVVLESKNKVVAELPATLIEKNMELTGEWKQLNKRSWKQLTSQRLSFSLITESGKIATGVIVPKTSCNSLQAVLYSARLEDGVPQGAGGSSIIHLHRNGTLSYTIQYTGLPLPVKKISIGTAPNRRGKLREACRVPADSIRLEPNSLDGMMRGRCKRLNARDVNLLLQRQLYVTITTTDGKASIRGPLSEIMYDQKLVDVKPILLTGSDIDPPLTTGAAGHAWIYVDHQCAIHYQVIVGGLTHQKFGALRLFFIGGHREKKWTVEEFVGTTARGILTDGDPQLFASFNRGNIFIYVGTKTHPQGEIGARVYLLNNCQDRPMQEADVHVSNDAPNSQEVKEAENKHNCFANGQVHKDGDSWVPGLGECRTCTCKRGQVLCHDVVCPSPDCSRPVQLPGDCCQQCLDESTKTEEKCYFNGDKRFHAFGTKWFPYVPPFGYMECAICECSVEVDEEVSCHRLPCPSLPCPASQAHRKSGFDCCPSCPDNWQDNSVLQAQSYQDMMMGDADESKACMFGQDKFLHGDEWHPRIAPFGVMDCITCRCKNGRAGCSREKCRRLKCRTRYLQKIPGNCCPICKDPKRNARRQGRLALRSL